LQLQKVLYPPGLSDAILTKIQDGICLMDTTSYTPTTPSIKLSKRSFPNKVYQRCKITLLLEKLDKRNLQSNFEKLTGFHNRWYKSPYGEASCEWLLSIIKNVIASAGADERNVTAEPFVHPWGQNSIAVRIPGKTSNVVVVGAHQDNADYEDPVSCL
jgi:leucyl aminopeptidase